MLADLHPLLNAGNEIGFAGVHDAVGYADTHIRVEGILLYITAANPNYEIEMRP